MAKEKAVKSSSGVNCAVSRAGYDSEMTTETDKDGEDVTFHLRIGHNEIDIDDVKRPFPTFTMTGGSVSAFAVVPLSLSANLTGFDVCLDVTILEFPPVAG